jgi:uncharacterized DUF497 family protein
MHFRWNDWNTDHIAEHGVEQDEAEMVVARARPPYPEERPDDKYLVCGRGHGDRLLPVLFIYDEDGGIYVIHARPLTEREKKRCRRRIK